MSLDTSTTSLETQAEGSHLRELDEAVISARNALESRTLPNSLQSESLDNLADTLWKRFKQGGEKTDLEEAIYLHRQVLEHRPSEDPLRPNSLNNLSKVLLERFNCGNDSNDLDEAIFLPKQALEIQSPTHPLLSESLDNLAAALWTRFGQGGQQSELDNAISLHRQALELRVAPHPDRSMSLNNLAAALCTRFQQRGQVFDLDDAISIHRQALELRVAPHPDRSMSLNNLAVALCTRFQQRGQVFDLDEAIFMHRQALELRVARHPNRLASLNNLAVALLTQFGHRGQQYDLDEAISMHRQALGLRVAPHPDKLISLSNLAVALWTQFKQGGQTFDLDEAISIHRQALELRVAPHPQRSMFLNRLAVTLWTRFQQRGQAFDLDEAISIHRQALELRVAPHPQRSTSLNNLAVTLLTQFGHGGQQSDLDEAISMHRQALELRVAPHPSRSMSLNNLATTLHTRFKRGGQQCDLDEAIFMHRQALELQVAPHPDRLTFMNNLAFALHAQFWQGGRQCDLDEAISLHRQTLELQIAPHPNRWGSLSNLALALWTQFQQGGLQSDLDEAISLHRQALELQVASHPDRSTSLNYLASALHTKFWQGGQQCDLDEAILLRRQAVQLQPSLHPGRYLSLHGLGMALIDAYSLYSRNPDHLKEAMDLFLSATQCINQPASFRLDIANMWIKEGILHRHTSLIDAYEVALQALPKLAAVSFDIKLRQEGLFENSDGLARDASRFAIQAGKIDKAVQFLEEGRAIFWSQFLSLRSPFEQLNDIAPELADKLRDTASALELGSHRNTLAGILDNHQRLAIDQEAARLNRLDEEWSKAIEDVRRLSGFEDFLRPRSLSALQMAASDGPVVMLVGNDEGSNILILTSADVRNISLPGLSSGKLQTLVYLVQAASSDTKTWSSHFDKVFSTDLTEFPAAIRETLRNVSKRDEERGMRYENQASSDDIFKFVLKFLWNDVVKPVIDELNLKKSAEPPVVQWCPTGLFSFLPIYAAGCYDDGINIECALDYFISSYTPTIGVLLTPDRPLSTEPFKMMAVIQSHELPATRMELKKIEQHVPSNLLVKFGIPGASASVEAVASKLSDVSIVHFSCHGKQDQSNPLDSGLKLEDGWLRVSRIIKEKIPNRALAFLCACETAMGVEKLPDEAMSLGASLLFSGFRHIIATMWEMMDEDGPVIADAFYEELFRGPDGNPTQEPDVTKSARALHLAVKKLRAKNVSFRRWVPFIHMGKGK